MSAPTLDLAERIAGEARDLGVETAIIGALALAAHGYVRGTADIDLATCVDPDRALRELQERLRSAGLRTQLNLPDDEDALGGLLKVWTQEDEDGDPVDVVEVINFSNPHRPLPNPGADAVRNAVRLDAASHLRYVRLPELVALKLYAGGRRDLADVVELLKRNPDADLAEVRAVCRGYGQEAALEPLIQEAQAEGR